MVRNHWVCIATPARQHSFPIQRPRCLPVTLRVTCARWASTPSLTTVVMHMNITSRILQPPIQAARITIPNCAATKLNSLYARCTVRVRDSHHWFPSALDCVLAQQGNWYRGRHRSLPARIRASYRRSGRGPGTDTRTHLAAGGAGPIPGFTRVECEQCALIRMFQVPAFQLLHLLAGNRPIV